MRRPARRKGEIVCEFDDNKDQIYEKTLRYHVLHLASLRKAAKYAMHR